MCREGGGSNPLTPTKMSVKEYYTYILYSESRNRYYIGSTNNLERRLEEHNHCHTKSTRSGIPWKIVYTKSFESSGEAKYYERFLKKQKSRKFIERLIQSG
jgi:putative endonuclease